MLYLIAGTDLTSYTYCQQSLGSVGMLLTPNHWRSIICPYALDNGVYAAWVKGRLWDQKMHEAWLKMLSKVPPALPPLWVLLPDAVGDWPRTLELARLYLPTVRQRTFPVAVALQNGCDFAEAADLEPDWVFVAGSTQWKEANVHAATAYFHPLDVKVHVGRVNTSRRLRLCQSANVDSVDGSVLNKFRDVNLPILKRTFDQPCLHL